MRRGIGRLWPTLTLTLWPALAMALPPEAEASRNDDDVTITLRVDSQTIPGDSRSRCWLRFEDAGRDVVFSDGDTVDIRVYEDDLVGDELLWSTRFDVAQRDLVNGGLTREYDCSSAFGADGVGTLEVYATATVVKDECGLLCLDDSPTTANISLAEVEDDGNEDDDGRAAARGLVLGRNADRIARDQDWQSVALQSRSRVSLRVDHRPEAGRLDVVLLDGVGNQVAQGRDEARATVVEFEPLDAGTIYFRVSPREGNDYNFYDLQFALDTLAGDCAPGAMESQACENCGSQERACDANGRWLPWGDCGNQGECSPGATRAADCGLCGTTTDTCDAGCMWVSEPCHDEGVCEPGAEDEEICPEGGTRVRVCSEVCLWGDYGDCGGAECENGEARECYSGPAGTQGVGACRVGVERCVGGRWAPCDGQLGPALEQCEDAIDNDCDGDTDALDGDCDGEPRIGDPCQNDAACADGQVCLLPASHRQFPDGYCGVVPCQEDCGDGAPCVGLFGRQYCLRACSADRDCRPGYRCLEVQPGDRVCAPPCEADADCGDPRRPSCDVRSGLCVAEAPGPDPDRDMGVAPPTAPPTAAPTAAPTFGPAPDMGVPGGGPLGEVDAGAPAAGGSSGTSAGCTTGPAGPARPLWLVCALPLLIGARRRRR